MRKTKISLLLVSSLWLSHATHIVGALPIEQRSTKHNDPPQPAWNEFAPLLGQSIAGPIVQRLVKKYHLSFGLRKGDSGDYSNFHEVPFSLLFRGNKIERIVVTISTSTLGDGKNPVYRGALPLGLQRQDKPEDIVRRLGPPESRFKNDWLLYEKLGLWLSFNRKTNHLSEIDIDDPSR